MPDVIWRGQLMLIAVHKPVSFLPQDVVHFYVRQKSAAGCNAIAAQIDFPLSDGEWHHIVFAVEDAGVPKVEYLYGWHRTDRHSW